jgi:hypothetical protein
MEPLPLNGWAAAELVCASGRTGKAIPVAYDQPGVAARIADKQTGVVISLDKLTADHLSTLLNEVLNNSTYRNNARKLQKAIAETERTFCCSRSGRNVLGVTKRAGGFLV